MATTTKITKPELVKLIKEEVARAKKIKSLKEEKSKIDSLLREMEGMDEYAEMQPSDVPGATAAPVLDATKTIDGAAALTKILGVDAMNAIEKEIMKSDDHKKAASLVSALDKGEKKATEMNEEVVSMATLAIVPAIVALIMGIGYADAGLKVKSFIQNALMKSKADPKEKKAVADALAKAAK